MDSSTNDYGVMGVFICRKRPHVNCASSLRDLEPAGTERVSRSCNSQLALFTTERWRGLRPALAPSKTSLKHMSV
jgi:hypothetical protein